MKLSKEPIIETKEELPIINDEAFSFNDLPIKKEKKPSSPKKTTKNKKN